MAWLNALLAFSLAMIVFCTIVSGITETIHHFFQLRRRGLEEMLAKLFDEFVQPKVGTISRSQWIDELTRNLGVPAAKLSGWVLPTKRDSLSTIEFVRRVAESPAGAAIRTLGEAETARYVNALAVRFERAGRDASAYFGQRARTLSILIALALAFTLNIDAFRLMSAFLTDSALTERVLAQSAEITAPYRPPADVAADFPGAPPAAVATPTATATATSTVVPSGSQAGARTANGAPDQRSDGAHIAAIARNAANALALIQQSAAFGLPIGASYFPYCANRAMSPDRLCEPARVKPWHYVGWFLSTLLAGFLIGLGGPFWYNAFSHISGIVQVARRTKSGDRAAAEAPEAEPAPVVATPSTPAEVFRAASDTSAPPTLRSRVPLSPRGTRDVGGYA